MPAMVEIKKGRSTVAKCLLGNGQQLTAGSLPSLDAGLRTAIFGSNFGEVPIVWPAVGQTITGTREGFRISWSDSHEVSGVIASVTGKGVNWEMGSADGTSGTLSDGRRPKFSTEFEYNGQDYRVIVTPR